MSQQINLFSPSLRPLRRPLTASRLALALGVFALAMLGYGSYTGYQTRQDELVLDQGSARLKEIQDQALQLGRTSVQAKSQALEQAIVQAESELRLRQALLERLKGGGLGNTRGFSDYMIALARQRTEGVWITGLAVTAGGGEFTIRGGVSRPEILPAYIRRLNREEVLRGRQIGDLRMQRKEVEIRAPRSAAGSGAAAANSTGQPPGRGAPAQRWRFVEFSLGSATRSQPGG
ncbi:MAG: hypothetical protein WA373_12595 [Burkholderiales bacterium]